jgi:flagellar biosynthesis/type III secretory pathway protein FliH
MTKIKISGDSIYFDGQLVANIAVKSGTVRENFIEAIDSEAAFKSGYEQGKEHGWQTGYDAARFRN